MSDLTGGGLLSVIVEYYLILPANTGGFDMQQDLSMSWRVHGRFLKLQLLVGGNL